MGCFGLRAAIELILEMGVGEIAPAVQSLGDQVAEGARRKGYELMGERTPANGAGIVSFRKEGLDARYLYRELKDQGFLAAPRLGWLRVAPHFYITPEEIERLVDALP